jgi:hypothetical protein
MIAWLPVPALCLPFLLVGTLEILFLFFTPQGGTEKSGKEFREGSYTPSWGVSYFYSL